MRRFPYFAEMDDPVERRQVIIRFHAEGWTVTLIAGYLQTSRQTVHATLKRWVEEQFAGLEDKPHRCQKRQWLLLQKASKKKYSASISGILLYDRVNLSNHMLRNQ
jgi:transposase